MSQTNALIAIAWLVIGPFLIAATIFHWRNSLTVPAKRRR